jgi:hypothetical protein
MANHQVFRAAAVSGNRPMKDRACAERAPDVQPTTKRHGVRDSLGRFAAGNTARLRHGRYSKAVLKALLPEQSALLDVLAAREAAMVSDLGGRDDLSQMEIDLVVRYQQLGNMADYAAARMLNSRASIRREASATFMQAVDRQLAILKMLGIARRQKQPRLSTREWLLSEAVNDAGGSDTTRSHDAISNTNEE